VEKFIWKKALVVLCFLLAAGQLFSPWSIAQAKSDAQKAYAEIAGNYEFQVEGQTMVLVFFVKDGVLLAKSQLEVEEVEIKSIDLAQLKFEATNERGQYYELVFLKDEAGKIAKCKVTTMGVELEGTRIK